MWSISAEPARLAIWGVFLLGWTILFIATWLISHFELFGIAQAWRHSRGVEPPPQEFRTPFFYRWIRHPIYTGFLIAFWATPDMTYSHLLLALGMMMMSPVTISAPIKLILFVVLDGWSLLSQGLVMQYMDVPA